MKIIRLLLLLFPALLLSSCNCNPFTMNYGEDFVYTILKAESPSDNLIIFECSPDIYGVDPATRSVKMHVRMENMVMGGATKLPNGGIAFTCHRKGNNNAWGAALFVTDKNYKITGDYPICDSPMGPKLVGNTLFIGSSAIEDGMKHKLNLYDATTFKLKKEFLFDDMVDSWNIADYRGEAYFGVCNTNGEDIHSHYYRINPNTLELKEYDQNIDFLKGLAALHGWIEDDRAYLTNGVKKEMGILNLSTGVYDNIISLSAEPEISNKNMRFLLNPVKIEDDLYAILHDYEAGTGYYAYVVKVSLADNKLTAVTKLPLPPNTGYTSNETLLHDGRKFILRVDGDIYFINLVTATIEHTVKLHE